MCAWPPRLIHSRHVVAAGADIVAAAASAADIDVAAVVAVLSASSFPLPSSSLKPKLPHAPASGRRRHYAMPRSVRQCGDAACRSARTNPRCGRARVV